MDTAESTERPMPNTVAEGRRWHGAFDYYYLFTTYYKIMRNGFLNFFIKFMVLDVLTFGMKSDPTRGRNGNGSEGEAQVDQFTFEAGQTLQSVASVGFIVADSVDELFQSNGCRWASS